jgi:haloalkane dehalogenase
MVTLSGDLAPYRDLDPFEGRWLDRGGARLHYLDEGHGEPVVMLHGNPSWSFLYRDLVRAGRERFRAIVPDHMGMGLSDKPGDDRYAYTLASRVADLEAVLDAAGVDGPVSLVLHDWGGMIGMAWAARHVDRVKRIVALNTAAFRLPEAKPFPLPLRIVRDTPVGSLLVRGANAFADIASRTCTVKPLPDLVRRGFIAPYASWDDRIATLRFVQDIPLAPGDAAWDLVAETEAALSKFADVPMLLGFGERDWVFDKHFLAEWKRRFPLAEVHSFADAGHYVLEDKGDVLIPRILDFLEGK